MPSIYDDNSRRQGDDVTVAMAFISGPERNTLSVDKRVRQVLGDRESVFA